MWFATPQKVFAALDALSEQYDELDKRLAKHELSHQHFGAELDNDGEYKAFLDEIRSLYWMSRGAYSEASVALSFGQVTAREATRHIKPAKLHLSQLQQIVAQLDKDAELGRKAFHDMLDRYDAPNN
jgi:hypothetical protein